MSLSISATSFSYTGLLDSTKSFSLINFAIFCYVSYNRKKIFLCRCPRRCEFKKRRSFRARLSARLCRIGMTLRVRLWQGTLAASYVAWAHIVEADDSSLTRPNMHNVVSFHSPSVSVFDWHSALATRLLSCSGGQKHSLIILPMVTLTIAIVDVVAADDDDAAASSTNRLLGDGHLAIRRSPVDNRMTNVTLGRL